MGLTPPASAHRTSARIDGIDLLRGLAIFLVLMNHVNMRLLFAHVPYTRGLPAQLVSSLVWNGQQGVQIFFAVSGFLITSTSLWRWGSLGQIDPAGFYLLRAARIGPLLLLLLATLSALHLAGAQHFVVPASTGGLGRALLAACTFHINLLEARRGYLPANWDILWSLSVEEIFYLFFPLLCRIFRSSRLLVPVLLVFVVLGPFARTVLAHGNPVWQEYSYLGGMDAIALGCLTALLPGRLTRQMRWLVGSLGCLLLAFCLGASLYAYRWGLDQSGLSMSLVACGVCMVMLVAAQTGWRSPGWLAPFRLLGLRSYEVYLTHMFMVFAVFGVFVAMGKPLRAVPALFALVVVSAAALGELASRLYSEPLNGWLRAYWRKEQNGLRPALARAPVRREAGFAGSLATEEQEADP